MSSGMTSVKINNTLTLHIIGLIALIYQMAVF